MQYSLRTLFLGVTVACLLCWGSLVSETVRLERVSSLQGSGQLIHLGPLRVGCVDFRGDDRHTLLGVWRIASIEDGGIGPRATMLAIIELELATGSHG
jgi:hypothetical protein